MARRKFTLNAFIFIVILFSAMMLFFLVKMTDMADISIVNDVYEIEGTDYSVRYQELKPSGLYKGKGNAGRLVVEGNFGFDWGAVIEGDSLFCNEYKKTSYGYMLSDVVKIDLVTYEKETVFRNAMMIGRCESGEMVCLDGFMMPLWSFDTNSLYKTFSMSSPVIESENDTALVRFVNPATMETVRSFRDSASDKERLEYYRSFNTKEAPST